MKELTWEDVLDVQEIGHRALYLALAAQMLRLEVKSIVEIGVFDGNASRIFRYMFPKAQLYLVDPWDIYPDYKSPDSGPISNKIEEMEEAYRLVQNYFRNDPRCEILRMTSKEAANKIPNGIDLVFIDGNHSYPYVKEDISLWLPKVRKRGILSGHDYHPKYFPGVVRAVNEAFLDDVVLGADAVWYHLKR